MPETLEVCKARKDFIRHIANKVLAQALDKIPASAVSEIRKRLGRLEDKYDFSAYGGRPERLVEALSSQEWRDLVDYAEKMNVTWVLKRILELASEAYRECSQVREKILAELRRIEQRESGVEEELTLERVYRDLKFRGFKVAQSGKNTIIIDEGNITANLRVENGVIEYTICRKGKATSLEGLLVKLDKLREI